MKYFLQFFWSVLLGFIVAGCKSQPGTPRQQPAISEKKSFAYNQALSNFLVIKTRINNQDSALLALDNGTYEGDVFFVDKGYAIKSKLIPDSSISSLRAFQTAPVKLAAKNLLIQSVSNQTIADFPKSKNVDVVGLIGMGFLKRFILEINYADKYFALDSLINIDLNAFWSIDLGKKGLLPSVDIKIYTNGTLINGKASLDLGYEGEGLLFSGSYVRQFPFLQSKIDSAVASKNLTSTGEPAKIVKFKLDSVTVPYNSIVKNIESQLAVARSGILSGSMIIFGNSFLKNFGQVFIDFRKNKLYLKKL